MTETMTATAFAQPEPLAAAVRSGKLGDFKTASGYAACLVPLLEALGWRGEHRHLMEAMPHFADGLDLADFRNVLAALGYATSACRLRLDTLDPRVAPCLFVPRRGAPLVVLDATPGRIRVFDGGRDRVRDLHDARIAGAAYVVRRTVSDDGARADAAAGSWTWNLVGRFRALFVRLLVMSFTLNLLALAVPIFIMTVYDKVIGGRAEHVLYYLLAGMALVLVVDVSIRIMRARILAYIGARADILIAAATLRQILYLPPAYTELAAISNQVARIREFQSVREFFTGPLATVVLELPFVLIFVAVIAWLGGWLAAIPLAVFSLFLVAGIGLFPVVKRRVSVSSRLRSDRHGFLVEMLSHLRAIKQLAAEPIWLERYRAKSAEVAVAQFEAAQMGHLMQTLSHGFMMAAGIATLIVGTGNVIEGTMTVGALVASMALVWRVLSPLQTGFVMLSRLEQIAIGIRQVDQLMRFKGERGLEPTATVARRGYLGRIGFNRISMRYRNDAEPALLGVSCEIRQGEMIALTGANGSGKSTMLKLMAGLYQPQAGSVVIDGLDIRQLDPIEVRCAIAYLPQVCHMFHGTIAQNLRLAEPTASDAALQKACEEAGLWDDILALPKRLESRIGDQQSLRLPAGFAQRLAVARALLKDAPILLFDEPGQGLDELGDRRFMDLLRRIKGHKTLVMVTHRPSHMRLADRLMVLEAGRVLLDGPPDQVLQAMPEGVL